MNSQKPANCRLAYRKYVKRHERSPPAKPAAEHKLTVVSARFRQVTTFSTVRNEAALYSRTVEVTLQDSLARGDGWPLRFCRGRSKRSTCSAQASSGHASAISLQRSTLCVRLPTSAEQLPVHVCSIISRSARKYVQLRTICRIVCVCSTLLAFSPRNCGRTYA